VNNISFKHLYSTTQLIDQFGALYAGRYMLRFYESISNDTQHTERAQSEIRKPEATQMSINKRRYCLLIVCIV